MVRYKIIATINGRKRTGRITFKTKKEAKQAALETNRFWYPSPHAKVVKVYKKRRR